MLNKRQIRIANVEKAGRSQNKVNLDQNLGCTHKRTAFKESRVCCQHREGPASYCPPQQKVALTGGPFRVSDLELKKVVKN